MKIAFDVKIFKFQEGRTLFRITSRFADDHAYKMTHCVSGFRDYVSEGGTDTYPNFWKRFSPNYCQVQCG